MSNTKSNSKTPFFQAIHVSRYLRQSLIREIQNKSDSKLVCYVAGSEAPVDRDDIVPFVDLLHNVPPNSNLDLLIHTGGGDIDAAEKIITMLRKKVGNARLRVIVPDYAKSAGTLICLGADAIVMSDTSELGPIDPQIALSDENGNRIMHSVLSYLDAYKDNSAILRKDPEDPVARIMLSKLDPARVKLFEAVLDRARQFAETQLRYGMFKDGKGNFTLAASELINHSRWQTHGQMISWEDAQDPKIGLIVEYQHPSSEIWSDYWQLYCLQRLTVGDRQKIFESDYASLCVDSRVC